MINPTHPYIITRSSIGFFGNTTFEYHLHEIKKNRVVAQRIDNKEAIEFLKTNNIPLLHRCSEGSVYGDKEFKEQCPKEFIKGL